MIKKPSHPHSLHCIAPCLARLDGAVASPQHFRQSLRSWWPSLRSFPSFSGKATMRTANKIFGRLLLIYEESYWPNILMISWVSAPKIVVGKHIRLEGQAIKIHLAQAAQCLSSFLFSDSTMYSPNTGLTSPVVAAAFP